jgi:branched-chain amino acid aminotransferase
MERFNNSCKRLAFPSFDKEEMKKLIEELLKTDINFLPNSVGECLYVRPTAMSMSSSLGVKRADMVKYFVILSPVKKYFAGPIHLAICETYDRGSNLSANGFKLGANYAPTVAITDEFQKQGISQALWLNNGYILESGATNIFFIFKTLEEGKEVVTIHTPPADGSILPGITRDSILELLPTFYPELRVEISPMHVDRFTQLNESGQMIGSFVSGTASVVGKVRSITFGEKRFEYNYQNHDIVENIKKMLTDIQHGYVPHKFSSVLE